MTRLKHFPPPEGPLRKLPFSQSVQSDGLLFLSGQLGTDPESHRLVEGGIVPEARCAMENMKTALERAGSSLDRVVKCTVFLASIDEWQDFNEVYVEFFPGDKPARSAFGGVELALGARVELECIAAAAD